MKKTASRTKQLEQNEVDKCKICNKRPINLYQLDYEGCSECFQTECFISFIDQVDIPEV